MKRFPMVAALIALAAFSFAQERFLVVTRSDTPAAVRDALLAANPLPNGEGITASGGVARVDDNVRPRPQAFMHVRGDDIAYIWPDGAAGPFAWFVTPESDAGMFIAFHHGGASPVVAVEHAQRLLIDGVLHRIGSGQLPGDRPGVLDISMQRRAAVIDATARSVEIPDPAKARVARARQVPPPSPDNPILGRATARDLDDQMIVWTGAGSGWRNLTLSRLLAGIYTEPDDGTRYLAVRVEHISTALATFSVDEIEAGTSYAGLATGFAFPVFADPLPADMFPRLAVAVPTGDPFEFFALGAFNGRNLRFTFPADPTDTITLTNGESVDVYVQFRLSSGLTMRAGNFAYFENDAVNP